ncbi:hypothetical protein HK099_005885 [Clydaea vesicula]|uniref:Ubiquitin-like domain-containing protein n=1 Tax=Clydaea vesicula TaxID=447962 RepID=A0AAD5U6B2_9FUNG|nr:hypothetical protein HK099_005885 [Clydaea vesicula]
MDASEETSIFLPNSKMSSLHQINRSLKNVASGESLPGLPTKLSSQKSLQDDGNRIIDECIDEKEKNEFESGLNVLSKSKPASVYNSGKPSSRSLNKEPAENADSLDPKIINKPQSSLSLKEDVHAKTLSNNNSVILDENKSDFNAESGNKVGSTLSLVNKEKSVHSLRDDHLGVTPHSTHSIKGLDSKTHSMHSLKESRIQSTNDFDTTPNSIAVGDQSNEMDEKHKKSDSRFLVKTGSDVSAKDYHTSSQKSLKNIEDDMNFCNAKMQGNIKNPSLHSFKDIEGNNVLIQASNESGAKLLQSKKQSLISLNDVALKESHSFGSIKESLTNKKNSNNNIQNNGSQSNNSFQEIGKNELDEAENYVKDVPEESTQMKPSSQKEINSHIKPGMESKQTSSYSQRQQSHHSVYQSDMQPNFETDISSEPLIEKKRSSYSDSTEIDFSNNARESISQLSKKSQSFQSDKNPSIQSFENIPSQNSLKNLKNTTKSSLSFAEEKTSENQENFGIKTEEFCRASSSFSEVKKLEEASCLNKVPSEKSFKERSRPRSAASVKHFGSSHHSGYSLQNLIPKSHSQQSMNGVDSILKSTNSFKEFGSEVLSSKTLDESRNDAVNQQSVSQAFSVHEHNLSDEAVTRHENEVTRQPSLHSKNNSIILSSPAVKSELKNSCLEEKIIFEPASTFTPMTEEKLMNDIVATDNYNLDEGDIEETEENNIMYNTNIEQIQLYLDSMLKEEEDAYSNILPSEEDNRLNQPVSQKKNDLFKGCRKISTNFNPRITGGDFDKYPVIENLRSRLLTERQLNTDHMNELLMLRLANPWSEIQNSSLAILGRLQLGDKTILNPENLQHKLDKAPYIDRDIKWHPKSISLPEDRALYYKRLSAPHPKRPFSPFPEGFLRRCDLTKGRAVDYERCCKLSKPKTVWKYQKPVDLDIVTLMQEEKYRSDAEKRKQVSRQQRKKIDTENYNEDQEAECEPPIVKIRTANTEFESPNAISRHSKAALVQKEKNTTHSTSKHSKAASSTKPLTPSKKEINLEIEKEETVELENHNELNLKTSLVSSSKQIFKAESIGGIVESSDTVVIPNVSKLSSKQHSVTGVNSKPHSKQISKTQSLKESSEDSKKFGSQHESKANSKVTSVTELKPLSRQISEVPTKEKMELNEIVQDEFDGKAPPATEVPLKSQSKPLSKSTSLRENTEAMEPATHKNASKLSSKAPSVTEVTLKSQSKQLSKAASLKEDTEAMEPASLKNASKLNSKAPSVTEVTSKQQSKQLSKAASLKEDAEAMEPASLKNASKLNSKAPSVTDVTSKPPSKQMSKTPSLKETSTKIETATSNNVSKLNSNVPSVAQSKQNSKAPSVHEIETSNEKNVVSQTALKINSRAQSVNKIASSKAVSKNPSKQQSKQNSKISIKECTDVVSQQEPVSQKPFNSKTSSTKEFPSKTTSKIFSNPQSKKISKEPSRQENVSAAISNERSTPGEASSSKHSKGTSKALSRQISKTLSLQNNAVGVVERDKSVILKTKNSNLNSKVASTVELTSSKPGSKTNSTQSSKRVSKTPSVANVAKSTVELPKNSSKTLLVNEASLSKKNSQVISKAASVESVAAEMKASDKEKIEEHHEKFVELTDEEELELKIQEDKKLEENFNKISILANEGDPAAIREKANYLCEGKGNVTVDFESAKELYIKAAALNDNESMRLLGLLYQNGIGTQKDVAEALKWFTQAYECGNIQATMNIGDLYAEGCEELDKDAEMGLTWYEKGANAGLTNAMVRIGVLYLTGELGDEEESAEQANKWINKAKTFSNNDAEVIRTNGLLLVKSGIRKFHEAIDSGASNSYDSCFTTAIEQEANVKGRAEIATIIANSLKDILDEDDDIMSAKETEIFSKKILNYYELAIEQRKEISKESDKLSALLIRSAELFWKRLQDYETAGSRYKEVLQVKYKPSYIPYGEFLLHATNDIEGALSWFKIAMEANVSGAKEKYLELKKKQEQKETVWIEVKKMDGSSIRLEVETGESVLNVKKMLERSIGMAIEEQLLIVGETELQDERNIKDYDVKMDCTVYLVKK